MSLQQYDDRHLRNTAVISPATNHSQQHMQLIQSITNHTSHWRILASRGGTD